MLNCVVKVLVDFCDWDLIVVMECFVRRRLEVNDFVILLVLRMFYCSVLFMFIC